MDDWPFSYFTKEEMACRCGCGGLPTHEFMLMLETIREEAGFEFHVTSGFRCSAHNQEVSTEKLSDGPHVRGEAVDLSVWGSKALRVIRLAIKHGMTGLGVMQKGPTEKRFLHIDCVSPGDSTIPRPAVWSY